MVLHTQLHSQPATVRGGQGHRQDLRNKKGLIIHRSLLAWRRGRGTPHPAPPITRDSSGWVGTQTESDSNKTGLIIRRSLWWPRRGRGTPHPAPPTGRDSSGRARTQRESETNETGLIIRRSLWRRK